MKYYFASLILVIMSLLPFPANAELLPGYENSFPQKITKTVNGVSFDSDYDNGSLLNVEPDGSNTFQCELYTEDGEIGPRKYWFRFRMYGTAGRKITLMLDHHLNPRPVVKLGTQPWRRLTTEEAPDRDRIILTFGDENFAELAFFFPSGYSETFQKVGNLVRRCDEATSKVIGQSFMGRDIWMVEVTDRSVPNYGKHRVWIHSRIHAGEVTSTLTMLGMLQLVTEDTPLGRYLRRHIIFNIVPLVNVDGVWLGHTRWDSQGIDPERQWANPDRIPETAHLYENVNRFMAGGNPIEISLNLHSTIGTYTDTFFFKHVQPSVTEEFENIQQRYIDAFSRTTPLFDHLAKITSQLHESRYIESYYWNNWGESVMAMTHEGHFYRRTTDQEWITDEDYYDIGRAMIAAMIEYFNLPPAEEVPRKNIWIHY